MSDTYDAKPCVARFYSLDGDGTKTPIDAESILVEYGSGNCLTIFPNGILGDSSITLVTGHVGSGVNGPSRIVVRPGASNVVDISVSEE